MRVCMLRMPTLIPARSTAPTSKPAPSSSMRSSRLPGSGWRNSSSTFLARLCLSTFTSDSSTSRVSAMHCRALGGVRHLSGNRQVAPMSSSSNSCMNRCRNGAIHSRGVAGTLTPALEPLSIV
ncbi:hypothetical protein D9M68_680960 [compost metagenome]